MDLPGYGSVDVKPWRDEDQVRTLATGGDRGHGGPNAEFARLVTCGSDNPAFAAASDSDRAATQVRVIALFNGRVESVHVDVDDTAQGGSLQVMADGKLPLLFFSIGAAMSTCLSAEKPE